MKNHIRLLISLLILAGAIIPVAVCSKATVRDSPQTGDTIDSPVSVSAAVNNMVTSIKEATQVTLVARDRSIRQSASSEQRDRLMRLLRASGRADSDLHFGGMYYPDLVIELWQGTVVTELRVPNPSFVQMGRFLYQTSAELWPELMSWLPPEQWSPESVSSMFQATRLEVWATFDDAGRKVRVRRSYDGTLTWGYQNLIFNLVRLLSKGELVPKKSEPSPLVGTLEFAAEDRREQVAFGSAWFKYRGNIYTIPDLSKTIQGHLAQY